MSALEKAGAQCVRFAAAGVGDVELAATWELAAERLVDDADVVDYLLPGCADEPLSDEQPVYLRFVDDPEHYILFCSTDLGEYLRELGEGVVSVVLQVADATGGHSVCAIDEIRGRRLARFGCTFDGIIGGAQGGSGILCGPDCEREPPWAR